MTKQIKFTLGNMSDGYKTAEIFIGKSLVSYKILRSGLLDVDKKNPPAAKASEEWL